MCRREFTVHKIISSYLIISADLNIFYYDKQFSDATAAPAVASSSSASGPKANSFPQSNPGTSSSAVSRSNADVMAAVVGEVEAALRSLERERNTDTVSV